MKMKESNTINYCMRISDDLYQFLLSESKVKECSVNLLLKNIVNEYKEKQETKKLEDAFSQIDLDDQDVEYGIHAQNEVIHDN
ncbi:hypothetical protein LLG10_05230 [bacterium]|nr:hypothetical protein [bacterium]